jgi:dethiobiotin synthetase
MARTLRPTGAHGEARSDQPFDFDVSGYAPLPRLAGLFVTGTDTGVGKTLVTGAIARALRAGGRTVEVFKPVASGCRRTREGLVSEDAEFLAACSDSRRTLAQITPVRYAAPLAPNVAAAREGRPVDLEAIFEEYRRLAGAAEVVLVEGVGGLLCPLSDDFWVIHLARMMQLPLVVVARAGLGTINHTLLTVHAARSAGLRVAGVVVNRYRLEPAGQASAGGEKPGWQGPSREPADAAQYGSLGRHGAPAQEAGGRPMGGQPGAGATDAPAGGAADAGDADLSMQTNPQQIAQHGRVRVLTIVPDEPANSVKKVTLGPNTLYAVRQVDWQALSRQRA